MPMTLCWSAGVMSSGKLLKWGLLLLLVGVWHACAATVPDPDRQPLRTESPAASKIAAPLQRVVQRMQQDGITAANVTASQAERYSTAVVRVDAMGRVHTVILVTTFDTQVEALLTSHQVVIEHVEAQTGFVQAWLPFEQLEAIAALPFVRYLRPPSYASRR